METDFGNPQQAQRAVPMHVVRLAIPPPRRRQWASRPQAAHTSVKTHRRSGQAKLEEDAVDIGGESSGQTLAEELSENERDEEEEEVGPHIGRSGGGPKLSRTPSRMIESATFIAHPTPGQQSYSNVTEKTRGPIARQTTDTKGRRGPSHLHVVRMMTSHPDTNFGESLVLRGPPHSVRSTSTDPIRHGDLDVVRASGGVAPTQLARAQSKHL
ncbi:hypothetical protein C8F04DRAFT_1197984 [Mycena alexandri]|uniref:Uncharacterized protein n=1 Tax=Mycena alexandri TaxID=1745969 RepID=A0AAD6S1A1_9AGAR|nr:hypothetical protein C8F04DRAFT_1197984 [Mycena alexandri]